MNNTSVKTLSMKGGPVDETSLDERKHSIP